MILPQENYVRFLLTLQKGNTMKRLLGLVAILWAVGGVCTFSGCTSSVGSMPVVIERVENEWYQQSRSDMDSLALLDTLVRQYGPFFNQYTHYLFTVYAEQPVSVSSPIRTFWQDSLVNMLYRRVEEAYPDMTEEEKQLGKAFYRYQDYFPGQTVPKVYTVLSVLRQSIMVSDSVVAIALDKYLGSLKPWYTAYGFAEYQTRIMRREYIPTDVMKAWLYAEFPNDTPETSLLHDMVYEGKILYAVHQLLPEAHDSLLFGFDASELRWCKENERLIWEKLIDESSLYSTDRVMRNRWMQPAPSTIFLDEHSPGRAVIWNGYAIVQSYMKQHPEKSLQELLKENDAQGLLMDSHYNP